MNTINEIARKLIGGKNILLYPHVLMDGDALGSSVSLCKALRKLGKESFVLIEDQIAANISFMDNGYCFLVHEGYDSHKVFGEIFGGLDPDICACIDCGEVERFKIRKDMFLQGKTTICIDHHSTSLPFADYNFIDGSIAATGEIVYNLIKQLEKLTDTVLLDKEMGENIYAAITTDTGNFQYSNTTKDSHRIVIELMDMGIDCNSVSIKLYQNVRLEKMRINNMSLNAMKVFGNGKGALAYVTQTMLKDTGATMDETDGIVEALRNISGVEIAVFLKEHENGAIKVGMRAKSYGNVAEIVKQFGGGGHIKAAGCTLSCPMDEAIKIMTEAVEESLNGK